jgi:pyruvyltransferase
MTPNVGDALTPWLIKRLGLHEAAWVPPSTDLKHYIVTGSVLNWATKHSIVWGAGLASWKDEVNIQADIRAVRGPLSLMRLRSMGWNDSVVVLGDPALLLPKLVIKDGRRHHGKLGIVPHYVDVARFADDNAERALSERNAVLIDPLLPVEEFCQQVAACSRVVSSSLHGLIIADAYGVPNQWAKFGDSIGGDGMKYWDHSAAVGRSLLEYPPGCWDFRMSSASEILNQLTGPNFPPAANPEVVAQLQAGLINSCPFIKVKL